MRDAYMFLFGKSEGKRLPEDLRWEDNIIMYLREMWWKVVDWMHLSQDRDR
jgi:hypothetical protein